MVKPRGSRFGSYDVLALIGVGGMGEVYRARDTRLGRDVAIKLLPDELTADADRLARFEREAKLLATLNHPHIASVYSLDEHEGTLYLAMELVEGETLEDKLERGALPVEEALRLALHIAEALEAAHEKGIVHRDLKPANVMLTREGVVKVLDFGLAKAFSGDPSAASPAHSPALSLAMTQAGLILGTAGYMAPEQASGQAADQRADVWAFGVVVYEMLTGAPLFAGESVPHILADVLRTEPDWGRLPKSLHPRVRMMLERCLAKKPRNRYAGIADARVDIEQALADPSGVADRRVPAAPRSTATRLAAAFALIALGALLAGVGERVVRSPPPDPAARPVTRFSYRVPFGQRLIGDGYAKLALSPDGRRFVYSTTAGLYLRELAELEPRHVRGSDERSIMPFFSPDGQSVAYWDFPSASIRRIGVFGGASIRVTGADFESARGQSWHDGTIFLSQAAGILRVPVAGGTAELVVPATGGEIFYGPTLLPDGDSLLFTVSQSTVWDAGQIVVQSLETGERKTLLDGGNDARYVRTGHIVYAVGDDLFGVAFDLETRSVGGGPAPLVEGVQRAAFNAAANYGVAEDGTLAYVTGGADNRPRTVVWVDRSGGEEPIDLPARSYVYVQLSPDGTRLALDARDEESDIWIFDFARAALQRLTFDTGLNRSPLWSPDGRRVVFTRALDGAEEIYWQAADGSGAPEPLTANSGRAVNPSGLTPDGSTLLFQPNQTPRDIFMVPLGEPRAEPVPLVATAANEDNAQVSPDGRWMAYQSNESGRAEIYVRPFPEVERGRWQISTGGGGRPLWRRDGRELFYLKDEDDGSRTLMAVEIDTEPGFRPSTPRALFTGDYVAPNAGRASYDVSLDGTRFLMIKDVDGARAEQTIVIVRNWFEELRQRVPRE